MLHSVQVDRRSLNVNEIGSGQPLLFVHGFPLDHQMWRFQIAEFSPTHRVIAPDLRGFGRSDVTPGKFHMSQMADDLATILDRLGIGEPVTLCGLSMGGYVAWEFWKRHRQQLARLILCDTRAIADSSDTKEMRRETAGRLLLEGPGFLAKSMPQKMFSPKTQQSNPELVNEIQKMIHYGSPAGFGAASMGMAARADATDWLPAIDVPTLVIVGADDVISPVDEMQSIATAIPGAQFVVVPDAGHLAPLENPSIVNAAIRDFLNNPAHQTQRLRR
jgi:pimeloyl-ACP methyl ester carboxylesterase